MSAFVDVSRALAWRNVRSFARAAGLTLLPMMIPLIFFATFAGGFGRFGNLPGFDERFPAGYTSFQFVFIWLQGCAFQGMFSGFVIARDFESGFAKRLMLAAPSRAGIVAGYVASRAATRGRRRVDPLRRRAASPGCAFNGSVVEIARPDPRRASCSRRSLRLWAAGIALRFRTIQAGPLMQMPIFVVIFLSPVFVPLALLKGWIKSAARVNPFTVFIEQGRNFIAGTRPEGAARVRRRVVRLSASASSGRVRWSARCGQGPARGAVRSPR